MKFSTDLLPVVW